jgi:hypothetical protein
MRRCKSRRSGDGPARTRHARKLDCDLAGTMKTLARSTTDSARTMRTGLKVFWVVPRLLLLFVMGMLGGCEPDESSTKPALEATDRDLIGELEGEFVRIGVHPDAIRQHTAWGATISALAGWNGKLYAGYGDWAENTGPVAVRPYDPRTGTFAASPSITADTEAIHNWREIGGRLYGLHLDQRTDTAAYAAMGKVVNGREVWTTERAPGVFLGEHIMDLATLDGRDMWLATCGVELLRRVDESARWQPADYGGFGCFSSLGVLGGKLYVQPTGNTQLKTTKVFDGTAWSDGPDLIPRHEQLNYRGWRPVTLAGRIVQRGRYPYQGVPTKLSIFGGGTFRLSPWYVHDHVVGDDGYLYSLTVPSQAPADREEITVRRTEDLVHWTRVASAPAGSRSLATLRGKLYVGATKARLFVLR